MKIYIFLYLIIFFNFFFCNERQSTLGVPPNCSACLVTTEADLTYNSGSVSVIDLNTFEIGRNIYEIYPDSKITVYDNKEPFIIERLGRDNIKKLDINNSFNILFEEKVDANPYDITFLNNSTGVASIYSSSSLYFFNWDTGKKDLSYNIDLSSLSNFGLPEISYLLLRNNFLYVVLQNLGTTSNPNDFIPEVPGKLIQINTNNMEITDIDIPCKNPISRVRSFVYNSKNILYMSCVDKWFQQGNEGIAIFNIDTLDFFPSNWLNNVGDVVDAILINDTKGYALILSTNWPYMDLVSFNPQTNTILQTIITNKILSFDLAVYQNKLIIGDKTLENHGIRIFDTNTNQELTTHPIQTALLPESFGVVEK